MSLKDFTEWPTASDANYACWALSCWWDAADKYRANSCDESAILSTGDFHSLDSFNDCGNAVISWLNANDIESGPLADAHLAIIYRNAGDEEITLAEISRRVDRVFSLLDKLASMTDEVMQADPNSEKRIKPEGKTVDIIRAIQADKDNDAVVAATGSTIGNVRKVRSLYEKGRYEI